MAAVIVFTKSKINDEGYPESRTRKSCDPDILTLKYAGLTLIRQDLLKNTNFGVEYLDGL